MGRAPCCDKANVKKGPWSPEEDAKLKEFIEKYGTGGNWIALPQKAGLKRCGKSCRLRWLNYLRPNIKHGEFTDDEDRIICTLYGSIGSRWSIIAAQLPGRTDNDIKNYWNTKLKKKLMGLVPSDQRKISPFSNSVQMNSSTQSQSFSSLAQMYRDCNTYYSAASAKSLVTGFESISSVQPNLMYNNNNIFSLANSTNNQCYLQGQEGFINHPMQFYPGKDNMLMFGGAEASCSSSDGSCSQISYGKDIKQEPMNGFQGFFSSNGYDQESSPKFMLDYGNSNQQNINNGGGAGGVSTTDHHQISTWAPHHDQKANGFCSNSSADQLQYDLEEVKQLISSSNANNSLLFFNDENKTHERGAVYYY